MAFPTTGVLATFTGTNGDDLPVYSASFASAPTGASNLEIQSNAATGTVAGNCANALTTAYGPNCEAYVTVATPASAGQVVFLIARSVQETSLATVDGYLLRYSASAGTDTLTIQRIDNGAQTSLGAAFNQEISAGDSIGIEIVDSTLTAYYKASGGGWTSLGSRTDTTHSASGKISLLTTSTTVRLTNLGGGTIHYVTATETSTATDSSSNTLVTSSSITENATASDSQSASVVTSSSINEIASALEVLSASNITNQTIAESLTAIDSSDGVVTNSSSVLEASTASDSSSNTLVANAAITESNSATESALATALFNATITETNSASETSLSTMIGRVSITEAMTAIESSDGTIEAPNLDALITETVSALEVVSATNTALSSITENTTASDASFTDNIIAASITEAAAATDTSTAIDKLLERVFSGSLAIRNVDGSLSVRNVIGNLIERIVR
ncbi:MAG: hypothetical protein WC733_00145 [Methylophilus sp.]|jgi:epidermal growth factor receptor substrate 15